MQDNSVCAVVHLMPSSNILHVYQQLLHTYLCTTLPTRRHFCLYSWTSSINAVNLSGNDLCFDYKAFLSMHIFKINTAVDVSELFCISTLGCIWSVLSMTEEIPSHRWEVRNIKTSLYCCYCKAVLHLGLWLKCAAHRLRFKATNTAKIG